MGRRGNPNWGKPEPFGPVVPAVSSFEEAVKELKLPPDQYVHSERLREWAQRNKNSKFIPESLLKAWGFEPDQGHRVVQFRDVRTNKFVRSRWTAGSRSTGLTAAERNDEKGDGRTAAPSQPKTGDTTPAAKVWRHR
jgi:hypothetical protein